MIRKWIMTKDMGIYKKTKVSPLKILKSNVNPLKILKSKLIKPYSIRLFPEKEKIELFSEKLKN